ncbi:hypothetical protein [Aeromonas simiae]|uniref:hypothetical protein n=1 Tax=Aeromonas simiae TaxID=218936 RepID=UPI00266BC4C6|nr:hypothetical protein [Aeromonas simiae]MDO2948622.1 hypothetical protein [Aeromonas simiae]MDO2952058.1 hypothetical protein [Aeromonas simiae]MDO2956005.1 hypothetical protein [Aeromonas simiae]
MQPHGDFQVQRQGAMVICRPSGPFNLDGARAYEAQFLDVVAPLLGQRWGIVEIASQFEAAGPEVMAHFRRQFDWCQRHGCRFLALVCEGAFKRYMAERIFADIPFEAMAHFGDEGTARQWLAHRLSGPWPAAGE